MTTNKTRTVKIFTTVRFMVITLTVHHYDKSYSDFFRVIQITNRPCLFKCRLANPVINKKQKD